MKKVCRYGNTKALKGILTVVLVVVLFFIQKGVCFADATGTVTAPSAKIRKSADINSEVIGSSANGKTITITAEVTDTTGTLWYEVYVDSNTKGYIRADLVSKDASSGDVPSRTVDSVSTTDTATDTTPVSSASGAETPAETQMDAQYASVKVPAAKIRSGASTSNSIVDSIPQNTQVIVSGSTNGTDGKIWYYVTFTGTGGQEKNGYVRSDLVELGDMVPVEEPQDTPIEDAEIQDELEEVPENKDYEVVYEMTEDGGEWYLYNNLENTKNKLSEIMEAVEAQEFNDSVDASTITKQRIVIIVLIVLIIIMAFIMTIMFFKIRDAYYEAYEDDEEDDEPYKNRREEVSVKKTQPREVKQSYETKQPQPRKRPADTERRMPVKEVTYEEDLADQIKPAPKKKAKNFMIDDEDFEFEFLNMKNKDR